jgi:hypothetical protein
MTALTTLKMVALAPIARATVKTTATVKTGDRRIKRNA